MVTVNELIEATKGRLVNPARNTIIRGISIDSRTIHSKNAFIAIKGSNFDGHDFIDKAINKGASCIIKESVSEAKDKARRVTFIEVQDTTRALGEIARFQRKKFLNIPVIAVTGSNGKTTTKEMIAQVLSKEFNVLKNEDTKNNQIGLPLTLLKLNSSYDIAVLEVGTNHPGEVEYLTKICQPNIGIIINIGPSHLEYLGDLGGVFREKYRMVENLEKPYIGILNADDDLLKRKIFDRSGCFPTRHPEERSDEGSHEILQPFGLQDDPAGRNEKKNSPMGQIFIKSGKGIILGFGIKNHCDFFASHIKNVNDRIKFCVNQKYKFTLKTAGYYNIYNALAAITVARIFGIAYKDIILRLNTFDFPQGRLKLMELNSVKFIDDTYNSNPLSLSQALNVLANFRTSGRKIFVMGDMLELGSYKKSFHYQAGQEAAGCCDVFITVGNLSKLAAKGAMVSRFDAKNIFHCQTINQARKILFNRLSLKKGDLVLVKGSRLMKMEEIFRR